MSPTKEAAPKRTTVSEGQLSKLIAKVETPRADLAITRSIIESGIELVSSEIIDVSRIIIDASIVDDNHVNNLGTSMKKKRGQVSPITVRARLDDSGEIAYDVIDGFHRSNAKQRNGDPDIRAEVVYGCDDEELYDLRVLAAGSVKSVQFARIAEWMAQSYSSSEFAESGLTVAQVFGLAFSKARRPRDLEVTPELVEQLRDWAIGKCDQWGKPVSSVYNILRVVEDASPILVRRVRTKGGGRDRTGQVTEKRLEVLVDVFPGVENYEIQELLMNVMTDNRLYTEEARTLAEEVKMKMKPGMTREEIHDLATTICSAHEVEREARKKTTDSFMDEMPDSIDQSGSVSIGPGRRRGTIHLGGAGETMEDLRSTIRDLEAQLEESRNGKGSRVNKWWARAEYLSEDERAVWERLLFGKEKLGQVARDLGLNETQILTLIRSSLLKRELRTPKVQTNTAQNGN